MCQCPLWQAEGQGVEAEGLERAHGAQFVYSHRYHLSRPIIARRTLQAAFHCLDSSEEGGDARLDALVPEEGASAIHRCNRIDRCRGVLLQTLADQTRTTVVGTINAATTVRKEDLAPLLLFPDGPPARRPESW